MTQNEFFEKYVVGNEENIEDPEVQKLWVEYEFTNILIESIDVITDKEVVEKILASDLWENENYILKKGKIQHIELLKGKELVEHLYEVSIDFLDENGIDRYIMKGICDKDKIGKYIEQEINVIVEKQKENNDLRFCCFLKG